MNEIVIATTTPDRAQQMQQTLVGHTMTGEALEQRPQVQYTSADDFLDAALRIYEIIAIRLVPSVQSPARMDVIADYRPAIFICEQCGREHANYPERIWGLDGISRRFVCSEDCRKQVQATATAEKDAYRANLGNPVEAALDGYYRREGIPDRLRNALTMAEYEEVGRRGSRAWSAAYRAFLSVLSSRCTQQGSQLPRARFQEHVASTPSKAVQQDLWEEMEGTK
ncbi:MAG: hypothetical protein H0U76_03965 [Ktedonobacteraceae bacterium]|nr:hypothetical protein [Ktedonobacteraceae bacterium]